MPKRPGFEQLCRLLLKHAAFTVGGGSVTMIALERDLVEQHHWLKRDQFRTLYGLARLTPGTSILALVTGIGWQLHASTGAIVALAVSTIPGSVLAALLAAAYQQVYEQPLARAFLGGTAAAVCGLIAASVWRMVAPYWSLNSAIVFLAALALALAGLSPFVAFIGLGVLGYFWRDRCNS